MKKLILLFLLAILAGGMTAAPQRERPEGVLPGGSQIPKEYIPTYYCVRAFFSLPFRAHTEHHTLDQLLERMGIPSDENEVKSKMVLLYAETQGMGSDYSSLVQYNDDQAAWEREQYRLIRKEITEFKTLYEEFLSALTEAELDKATIHNRIVEFGREVTNIGTTGDLDDRHKEALKLFEPPSSYNPWLE